MWIFKQTLILLSIQYSILKDKYKCQSQAGKGLGGELWQRLRCALSTDDLSLITTEITCSVTARFVVKVVLKYLPTDNNICYSVKLIYPFFQLQIKFYHF